MVEKLCSQLLTVNVEELISSSIKDITFIYLYCKNLQYSILDSSSLTMELQSIEQKQKLLRDEIIAKEIDAEAFMEYMGKAKDEGENIDLDNWTLAQLMDIINEFKEHLKKNKEDLLSSRISRDLRRAKIFNSVKKDKVYYDGTSLWDFQERFEQQCSKSQLAFEISPKITPKISIDKWEIKSVGGFLFGIGARNELELTISSNFSPIKVVRKDEDCDWLKNILIQKHAGSYVPPLPQFQQLSTDDMKGINSRIEDVTIFLNTLLKYPVFHYSFDFKQFLTQGNYKNFNDHKIRQTAFAIEKDVLEIQTPSGNFNVVVSVDLNVTLKQASKVAEDLTNLHGELTNSMNNVINDIESLAKSLQNLNDVTGKIGQKYSDIQQILSHEDTKLPTMLFSINEALSIVINSLKVQMLSLSDLHNSFAKPASRDWSQFLLFNRRHQNQIKNYLLAKQNLIKKKEKYLNDPTKWELPQADFIRLQRQGINKLSKQESFEKMFPSDNDRENRARIWLSFVNQNYLISFRQFITEHEKSLLECYLTFTERQMASISEINLSFAGFREVIGV